MRALLGLLGEDPGRDGLARTPARVVDSLVQMCTPTGPGPAQLLAVTFEAENADEMVTVGPIPFASVCEHHLLPFTGNAWIAYLPSHGRIVGLSKLPRVLDWYAARPQVQERLTRQITAALGMYLGVDAACVIDAAHSCMSVRGVRKTGAFMRTSSLTGRFRAQAATRAEFLSMIGPLS